MSDVKMAPTKLLAWYIAFRFAYIYAPGPNNENIGGAIMMNDIMMMLIILILWMMIGILAMVA
tara:strand:+ start:2310 stop:2498 length:189 start_codon:yes stop_codon:yes gene_type:complete